MAVLKSIKRYQVTGLSGNTTSDTTVDTYDATKTILFGPFVKGQNGTPRAEGVRLEKLNSTTVRAHRINTDIHPDTWFTLVEFTSGVTVTDYTSTDAADVTISAVTIASTFIVPMGTMPGGTSWDSNDFEAFRLSSTTNIEVVAGAAQATRVLGLQVVEYTGCSVQYVDIGTTGLTATSYNTSGFTTVDPRKTLIITSNHVGTTSGSPQDDWFRMYLNSAGTQLTAERYGTASRDITGWAQLIEFTDGTGVYHTLAEDDSDSVADIYVPIPSLPRSHALPLMSGMQGAFFASASADNNTVDDTGLHLVTPGVDYEGVAAPYVVLEAGNTTGQHKYAVQTVLWNSGTGTPPTETAVWDTITTPLATGSQRLYFPQLNGATPKGILFYPTALKPADQTDNDTMIGVGVSDGTTQVAYAAGAPGVDPTDVAEVCLTDACLVLLNPNDLTSTGLVHAHSASFGAGYVDLTWSEVEAVQFTVQVAILAGTGLSVAAINAQANYILSENDTWSQGSMGFGPDYAFGGLPLVRSGAPSDNLPSTRASPTIRNTSGQMNWFVAADQTSPNQWGLFRRESDSYGAGYGYSSVHEGRIGMNSDTGSRYPRYAVDTWDAGGITFKMVDETSGQAFVGPRAIGLAFSTTSASVWVGTWDSPALSFSTSTEIMDVSMGFQPAFAQLISSKQSAFETTEPYYVDDDEGESYSLGGRDAYNQHASWLHMDAGNGTSLRDQGIAWKVADVRQGSSGSSEIDGQGWMTSDGVVIDYLNSLTTARKAFGIAIEEISATSTSSKPTSANLGTQQSDVDSAFQSFWPLHFIAGLTEGTGTVTDEKIGGTDGSLSGNAAWRSVDDINNAAWGGASVETGVISSTDSYIQWGVSASLPTGPVDALNAVVAFRILSLNSNSETTGDYMDNLAGLLTLHKTSGTTPGFLLRDNGRDGRFELYTDHNLGNTGLADGGSLGAAAPGDIVVLMGTYANTNVGSGDSKPRIHVWKIGRSGRMTFVGSVEGGAEGSTDQVYIGDSSNNKVTMGATGDPNSAHVELIYAFYNTGQAIWTPSMMDPVVDPGHASYDPFGPIRKTVTPVSVDPPAKAFTLTGVAPVVAEYKATSLVPNGDDTVTNLTLSSGVNAWELVDEDPASPTTDNVVVASEANAELRVDLTDTPSDFDTMVSVSLDIVLRKRP